MWWALFLIMPALPSATGIDWPAIASQIGPALHADPVGAWRDTDDGLKAKTVLFRREQWRPKHPSQRAAADRERIAEWMALPEHERLKHMDHIQDDLQIWAVPSGAPPSETKARLVPADGANTAVRELAYLGAAQGMTWFSHAPIADWIAIQEALGLTGGDDPVAAAIRGLGVKDNHTPGSAAAYLARQGDPAVPALKAALADTDTEIRREAAGVLGQINTRAARDALLAAATEGTDGLRQDAAAALTADPQPDAEALYISLLSADDTWRACNAAAALGKIRSTAAVPHLERLLHAPPGWRAYYASLAALRDIRNTPLSEEIRDALDFLREAKFTAHVDAARLNAAAEVVTKNIEIAMPDLFDICLYRQFKGTESKQEPSARTILGTFPDLARPYLAIGMNDPDVSIQQETRNLQGP